MQADVFLTLFIIIILSLSLPLIFLPLVVTVVYLEVYICARTNDVIERLKLELSPGKYTTKPKKREREREELFLTS